MRPSLLLLAALLLPRIPAQAQTSCPAGTATADLDAGNVRARLYNDGSLFWKGAGNVYNVPKAPPGRSITPNSIFAASLWTGGRVGSDLVQSAATYSSWEFIPGPLDAQGQPPSDCAPYDRIATLEQADFDSLRTGWISRNLRAWPWQWGAPVVDGDGVAGNYNLAGGDRPELLGTQTRWWVMNAMGAHPRTASKPFPLEVQVTAVASAAPFPVLQNATLYRYRFVWRGTTPLVDFYAGLHTDADLGNATDDYVGADSARAMVYTYNSDELDEGSDGYGTQPPAIGLMVLQRSGTTWRQEARTARIVYKSTAGRNGEPLGGTNDYYENLQGLFSDGQVIYRCGDGYQAIYASCGPTRFTFTGTPETNQGWTMETAAQPSDHRMMASAGPVTLQPGEAWEVVFVLPWARGQNRLDSVARLRAAADALFEEWRTGGYAAGFVPLAAPPPQPLPFSIGTPAPNPARTTASLMLQLSNETPVTIAVFSPLGQRARHLPLGTLAPGAHPVALDVTGLAPGVYRVRITVKGQTTTRSLVVVR